MSGGMDSTTSHRKPTPKKKEAAKAETVVLDQEAMKLVLATVGQIEKAFGKGSVMRLGDPANSQFKASNIISTGVLSLDLAIGVGGGVPRGRVIEIFGPESSGKTTLALQIVANAQKVGGVCAFVDAEHALDTSYARNLGVDVDNLFVSQPDCGEQALEIVDSYCRGGGISVVVVDSVAALTPRAELEGEMGDSHMGLQARLMSQAMRKITASVSRTNTLVIFINQTRMKIGVRFGSPETTTGGMALKFYAALRLDIRRIGALKIGGSEEAEVIGNKTRVRVVKNKLAPPFRKSEFDIVYGKGADSVSDIFDTAVTRGIIKKSGAWYSHSSGQLGQGRSASCTSLGENTKLLKEIVTQIKTEGYI